MTRGPRPLMAIEKARKIAIRRGEVLDRAAIEGSHYDFILFTAGLTVFARVRRIRTHVSSPQEIARMFDEDIRQLRLVPQTPVLSREIWVLSPWRTWQYFRILDDGISEIRCDGEPVLPGGKAPLTRFI